MKSAPESSSYLCSPFRGRKAMGGACLVAILTMLPAMDAAAKLYRYHDNNGMLVIRNTIPKEFIAKGYDILTNDGRLQRRVPPIASAKPDSGEHAVNDRFLLTSYSSVSEIEAARDRKMQALSREIQLVEKNMEGTRKKRLAEEQRAANQQRSGRDVSEELLDSLAQLKKQEKDAERMLKVRQDELKDTSRRYEAYITRFRQLSKPKSQDAQ